MSLEAFKYKEKYKYVTETNSRENKKRNLLVQPKEFSWKSSRVTFVVVVEPQSEEGVCAFEALEGAEPFDASFDFSVEAFDEPVFADSAVYNVTFFVFFMMPTHCFVDGCCILVKAICNDFFRSRSCDFKRVLHQFFGVFEEASFADAPR